MNLEEWMEQRIEAQRTQSVVEEVLKQLSEPMSSNEFYTMYYLAQAQGKPLSVNEISAEIGLSQSATSRMLSKFEKTCEVIERSESTDDKRAQHISLTEHGHELLDEAMGKVNTALQKKHDE